MVERSASPTPVAQLLHRACQRADSLFTQANAKPALTRSQFVVLNAVKQSGGGSQSTLVDATGIDRSSMADLVGRLVKLGWLQRTRSKQDRRAYEVQLTAKGVAVLARAEPAARRTNEALLASLSKEERTQFIVILERILR
jgi:DNA-binding MarR family transcriptional regulator